MKLLFNQWGALWRRAEVPTVIRYTLARTSCTHTETGDWVSSPARCHKPGGDRRGRSALPELPGEGTSERESHILSVKEREREREEGSGHRRARFSDETHSLQEERGEAARLFSPPISFTHARRGCLFQETLCYLLRKNGLLSGQYIERKIVGKIFFSFLITCVFT